MKETIEVIHHTDEERDVKEIRFEYNNFHVSVEIAGEGMMGYPVSVFVKNLQNDDSILIDIQKQKELKVSIDYIDECNPTKIRSYKEWKKLEELEKALKIIGNAFK